MLEERAGEQKWKNGICTWNRKWGLSVNRIGFTASQLTVCCGALQQEDLGVADRKAKMIRLFLLIFQRAKAAFLYYSTISLVFKTHTVFLLDFLHHRLRELKWLCCPSRQFSMFPQLRVTCSQEDELLDTWLCFLHRKFTPVITLEWCLSLTSVLMERKSHSFLWRVILSLLDSMGEPRPAF